MERVKLEITLYLFNPPSNTQKLAIKNQLVNYLFVRIKTSVRITSRVQKKGKIMLYEKLKKAWDDNDAEAELALYHDDWEFKFHSNGKIMRKGDMTIEQRTEMMKTVKQTNQRCLYENEDILVTHMIGEFPNGSKDAVMMVTLKKDELAWRTETGSTPLSND